MVSSMILLDSELKAYEKAATPMIKHEQQKNTSKELEGVISP